MYVPGWGTGAVAGFAIDPATGSLTNLPGSPYVNNEPCGPMCPGAGQQGISMDPQGNYVYVADVEANGISYFKLNSSTGALTLEGETNTGGQADGGGFCASDVIKVDPSGSFVYALGTTSPEGCTGSSSPAIADYSIDNSNGSVIPGPPAENTAIVPSQDWIAVTP